MTSSIVNHSSKKLKLYLDLLNTGKWSDLTLSVGNEIFPVHRMILCQQSMYFAKLLRHSLQTTVNIESDATPGTFNLVLQYIYTGILDLAKVDWDQLKDLIKLSHQFELPHLKMDLVQILGDKLDTKELKCFTGFWNEKDLLAKEFMNSEEFLLLNENDCLMSRNPFKSLVDEKFQGGNVHPNEKEMIPKSIDVIESEDDEVITEIDTKSTEVSDVVDLASSSTPETQMLRNKHSSISKDLTKNATILVGLNKQNAFTTGAQYTVSEMTNTGPELIIDLGTVKFFNNLKFQQALGEWTSYYVAVSINCWNWIFYTLYQNCSGHQDYYFPDIVRARYIKIGGNVRCNSIRLSNVPNPPQLFNGFIRSPTNVINPDTVVVFGIQNIGTFEIDSSLPGCGVKHCTDITWGNSLRVFFKQPYYLTKVSVHLWGTKKQSFSIVPHLQCGTIFGFWKRFEVTDVQQFGLDGIVTGITIFPGNLQTLELCHIEGHG